MISFPDRRKWICDSGMLPLLLNSPLSINVPPNMTREPIRRQFRRQNKERSKERVYKCMSPRWSLCLRSHGPEVEQDRSRGWVCPVGGALNAEGVDRGVGRETVNRGADRPTGMHRPWGDFCVYRSALTPGAGRANVACNALRNEGFFGSLSPFPSSSRATRRPSSRPTRASTRTKVQPSVSRESATSTPCEALSKLHSKPPVFDITRLRIIRTAKFSTRHFACISVSTRDLQLLIAVSPSIVSRIVWIRSSKLAGQVWKARLAAGGGDGLIERFYSRLTVEKLIPFGRKEPVRICLSEWFSPFVGRQADL